MKNLITTITNIFKIQELRNRILITLALLLVYRLGSFIVLPMVDPAQLQNIGKQTQGGLLGLLDMFSGGAFSHASIFALGIMPYISASIVIQLLGIAIPYFQRLQKEGESGRKKINQITRYLTVFITAAQAPGYLTNLVNQVHAGAIYPFDPNADVSLFSFFGFSSILFKPPHSVGTSQYSISISSFKSSLTIFSWILRCPPKTDDDLRTFE